MGVVVVAVLASLVFTVVLVVVIVAIVGRVQAKAVQGLAPEGIELRSGPRTVRVELDGYRSTRVRHSSMRSRRRGELLLTRQRCALVSGAYVIDLGGPTMGDLAVTVADGALHLVTERPYQASGRAEVHVPLDDPERWQAALRARGARG